MFSSELTLEIRNILLIQLLLVLMLPGYAVLACSRLISIWKSIKAPFPKEETSKKRNKFREIDMTKFEP